MDSNMFNDNDSYNEYLNGTVLYYLGSGFYNVILDEGMIVTTIDSYFDFDIIVGDTVELISANTFDGCCYISGVKKTHLKVLHSQFKS